MLDLEGRTLLARELDAVAGIGIMFENSGVDGATVVCLVLDLIEISVADVLASRSAERCVGRADVR
uniref:Uncharacterized protein n=1 Tax=Brevibacterium sp. Ap13 TaxID=1406197 RepID=U5NZE7_9MICO|nr:hypothetical protein AP13_p01100 [Brevibacterium sp. Ap13]